MKYQRNIAIAFFWEIVALLSFPVKFEVILKIKRSPYLYANS